MIHRSLTIDHTKIPNTTQTDFPVLFTGIYAWLATAGNGGDVISSNGYDITFSSDEIGATPLAFERVRYSETTGEVEFWIKVPSISHTVDTVIYIHYGDPSIIADQADPASVWDSNFKSVHHYGDGTTLSAADSTPNERAVTDNTATAATGKIDGGAATHSTGSKKISYSDTGLPSGAGARTIEAWFKVSEFGSGSVWAYGTAEAANGAHCGLRFTSGGSNLQLVGWGADANLEGSYSTDAWYHVVVVYNGSALSLYLDGSITAVNAQAVAWDTVLTGTLHIGTQGFAGDIFNGTIDELRFSNVARSADWIAAQHANQSDPSTFYGVSEPLIPAEPTATAEFIEVDTTTRSAWPDRYGAEGYDITGAESDYPNFVSESHSGLAFYDGIPPVAGKSLQTVADPEVLSGGVLYSNVGTDPMLVNFDFTDELEHYVSLYFFDANDLDRTQQIVVRDFGTGIALDTRSISDFYENPVYLTWLVSGHVQFEIGPTVGDNALVSGFFFGEPLPVEEEEPPPVTRRRRCGLLL